MIIPAPPLTGQAVDHRRLLLLLLLVWSGAVFPVHLADGGGAFPLDLGVKLLVEEDLVHQVRLHRAGLCRGLGGPVVISWKMKHKRPSGIIPQEHAGVLRYQEAGSWAEPASNITHQPWLRRVPVSVLKVYSS